MKTKTIFRKPSVIITAIVMALLIALAAVVVIMAEDKATFAGVQVATDGNINLRFYYSNVDETVTQAKVTVSDGNNGGEEFFVELTTATNGNGQTVTYFQVPLAAAQMGCDVTVVPCDVEGNELCNDAKNTPTWSVRKYAEAVLSNEAYADAFGALKAIVNYGQFATEYFADSIDNDVIVNDGIYARKTNPIIGMTQYLKAGEGPTAAVAEEFAADIENVSFSLALEDTISLVLYFDYYGEGVVTNAEATEAYVERNGVQGTQYRAAVENIATTRYWTDYSASLAVRIDGNVAITTANASVMSGIKALYGSSDAKVQNLALAMYNYYHWTANKIDQETCSHYMHYEYTTLNSGVARPVCTYCGKTVNYTVSDDINYFSAPGQVINNWACANYEGWTGSGLSDNKAVLQNIQSEDGVDFTRIYLAGNGSFILANGTVGYGANAAVYNNFMNLNAQGNCVNQLMDGQGIGRYVVLKVRTPGAVSIEWGFVNGSTIHNFGGNQRIDSYVGTDEWMVYVLDLKGSSIINANATTFNSVFRGNTNGAKDAYVDVAYMAVCDTIDEVKQITAGETKAVSNDIWWKDSENDTVHDLNGHDNCSLSLQTTTRNEKGEYVYGYGCANILCDTCETLTVPASVNYYSAPGQIVTNYNADTKDNISAGTSWPAANVTLNSVMTDPDGTLFTRVYWGNWGSVFLANGTATSAHGTTSGANGKPHNVDFLNKDANGDYQGVGQYAVIKIRTVTDTKNIGFQLTTDKLPTGAEAIAGGVRWIGKGAPEMKNEYDYSYFVTYVIDISKVADKDATMANILIYLSGNTANSAYLDIAYGAICDSRAEVAELVKNETFVVYTPEFKSTANNVVYNKADHVECTHSKVIGTTTNTNGDVTYTYECSSMFCGKTATVTVPANVNYYSAPGQVINNWGSSSNPSKVGSCGSVTDDHEGTRATLYDLHIDENGVYTRIHLYNSASVYLTNGTDAVHNSTNYGESSGGVDVLKGGMGQYVVLKVRTSNNTGDGIRFGIRTTDASGNITTRQANSTTRLGLIDTNGEFITYVAKFTADADEQFINVLFGNKSGVAPVAGAYIDLAYFAICDDYAEVASIVGNEDKVIFTTSWGDKNNATEYTKQAHDENIAPKLTGTVTNADGSVTYKYTCDSFFCTGHDQTVAAGINYYSAPGQAVNVWGTSNTTTSLGGTVRAHDNIIVDEDGIYSRIYMFSSGIVDLANGTGANHAEGCVPQNDLPDGLGQYIVFKIRTSGMNNVKFNIAVNVNGERKFVDGIGGASGGGYTPRNEAPTEFVTYVYEVTPNEGATAIHALIGHNNAPAAGAYLDVAYFAVCDSWAEIDALVGDDSVKFLSKGTSWDSTTVTELTNIILDSAAIDAKVAEEAAK